MPAGGLAARIAGSWWLRALLTIAILGYLASRIDMAQAGGAVLSVSLPHLAAVLALVLVDRLVMILRWVLLLRASDVPIATKSAAWIFLVSSFVGSFLPAGVGGDAARAWTLTQRTAQGSEALASVAVDRLLGVMSLVTLGLVGLVIVAPAGGAGDWRLPVAVMLLAAGCLAALWADRLVRAIVPDAWHTRTIGRRAIKLSDAVARYRARGGVLAQVMTWSLVVQLLRIAQAYLLGLGLGIDVPFPYYLLFMPIGLLMLLLPVSISGFGLPQGVFVWLLRPLGVPDEQSFALSTLIVLTGLAGNLPGLWLWLRARR